MIAEGDAAPDFALPAVVDGEFEDVALAEYLGDDIVVLAFYPADFNPSCSDEETDLDELDLFTMQKDVSVLGISADSVYSHRAFATEYDLHVPLLADVRAEVAADYGVAVEDATDGYLINRAVVVIDPGGEIQYVWETTDLTRLPPVETVREAVDDISGSNTAQARYRVGHAHYVEGRRAFTTGMGEFEEAEWMLAQGDFTRACEEFEEATDQFNTAARFAEDDRPLTYYERAEEKAQALWQAADWLADAASAYASGEGAEGEQMRSDAEGPLEAARDIHEPPSPDGFPPDGDPADLASEASVLPDDEGPPATLEADLDGVETPQAEALADEMDTPDPAPDSGEADSDDAGEADAIDDEELEEITAELEAQTQQAQARYEREQAETADAADPDTGGEDGDIELDLADPTGGTEPDQPADDDGDDEDDIDSDSHGVPDSL